MSKTIMIVFTKQNEIKTTTKESKTCIIQKVKEVILKSCKVPLMITCTSLLYQW